MKGCIGAFAYVAFNLVIVVVALSTLKWNQLMRG